jgi:hypothetical protein
VVITGHLQALHKLLFVVEHRIECLEESVSNLGNRMDQLESSLDSNIEMLFNRFTLILEERDRKLGLVPLTASSSNSNNNNNNKNSNIVLNSSDPIGVLNYGS